MATLSEVQTAARLASGAITAETVESLEMDPRVWPVPLATVQLPSVAAHWAAVAFDLIYAVAGGHPVGRAVDNRQRRLRAAGRLPRRSRPDATAPLCVEPGAGFAIGLCTMSEATASHDHDPDGDGGGDQRPPAGPGGPRGPRAPARTPRRAPPRPRRGRPTFEPTDLAAARARRDHGARGEGLDTPRQRPRIAGTSQGGRPATLRRPAPARCRPILPPACGPAR